MSDSGTTQYLENVYQNLFVYNRGISANFAEISNYISKGNIDVMVSFKSRINKLILMPREMPLLRCYGHDKITMKERKEEKLP